MQHLLEDIQADQTKRKTSQQGEDLQEELDCKELRLRLDAARYRFLKQLLIRLDWSVEADPSQNYYKYTITFEKVLGSFGEDRSFDDAVDASMEKDFHIDVKEVWQEWKLKLDAARYRFLKKHYLFHQSHWNEDPSLCRWEYQILFTHLVDNLAIDLSFDDVVDALMEEKNA